MINLTEKERSVYNILKDKRWYSYGIRSIKKKVGIDSTSELKDISISLSKKVGDKINFFSYNNINYIGFESRRLDYERDKKAGTNRIEKLIAEGAYD